MRHCKGIHEGNEVTGNNFFLSLSALRLLQGCILIISKGFEKLFKRIEGMGMIFNFMELKTHTPNYSFLHLLLYYYYYLLPAILLTFRPELIESTYLLYQATKNPFYLHVGKAGEYILGSTPPPPGPEGYFL